MGSFTRNVLRQSLPLNSLACVIILIYFYICKKKQKKCKKHYILLFYTFTIRFYSQKYSTFAQNLKNGTKLQKIFCLTK